MSFRRVDLLWEHADLVKIHNDTYDPPSGFELFDEGVPSFTLSPAYYMKLFTAPLPDANYATLVASTGGHWTTQLFAGLHDASSSDPDAGEGIHNILDFFGHAMRVWASEIQAFLDKDSHSRRGRRRQVVVRSYLPGHEECQEKKEPWSIYEAFKTVEWNWPWIKDFNRIFHVSSILVPGFFFLLSNII